MDMTGGQFHSLAAFPPAHEPSVPTEWEAGWAPEPVWTLWRTENFLLLLGIEPRILSLTGSLVDTAT